MRTRKEYLDGVCSHKEYYAQFVNDNVKLMVMDRIGIDILKCSKEEHFNDIPLLVWDRIGLPYDVVDLLKQAGDFYTLAGQACILKEAARQILDQIKK